MVNKLVYDFRQPRSGEIVVFDNPLVDGPDVDGLQERIAKAVRDAFGLGPTGKKKYGDGMVSMEVSYKPSKRRPVPRPIEEELRRDIEKGNVLAEVEIKMLDW